MKLNLGRRAPVIASSIIGAALGAVDLSAADDASVDPLFGVGETPARAGGGASAVSVETGETEADESGDDDAALCERLTSGHVISIVMPRSRSEQVEPAASTKKIWSSAPSMYTRGAAGKAADDRAPGVTVLRRSLTSRVM